MAMKRKMGANDVASNIEEYKDVLAARRIAYAAHVKGMTVDPALRAWAERMSTRGKTVRVWHQDLPWLEALMVIRYGEAIDGVDAKGEKVQHWPSAFAIADYGRAKDWEEGREEPSPVERARTMNLSGKE